ncbi:Crp/Fnr family transcriptional regulator [Pontibacter sp. JH31]|uniref:Crp/Fnr family transcriptional regulator n=1 Tax=Pontibacter aquaedesilientis TaxID=2766980 RepID=A0ABR7XC39_9BACT|nr:Crp/Fnr family transcriptional regulator [Pontibacter aquaedesilientis]MBD1395867.1 Crp/Fnr family transcriptional regulator [Pontibacter aquaedesilientis]
MKIDLLKRYIQRNVKFSDHELEAFCACFHPKVVRKNEFLLRQGELCKFEGFVVEGCFRVFNLNENGKENTLYFAAEEWWLMDIDSFMNQTPADLNMQALVDSTVLVINRQDKLKLYEAFPAVDKLFRVIFQKALVSYHRRVIQSHSYTAKERYSHFVQTYPHIAAKLTDKQIASYLGIRHEFLSKIKNS